MIELLAIFECDRAQLFCSVPFVRISQLLVRIDDPSILLKKAQEVSGSGYQ